MPCGQEENVKVKRGRPKKKPGYDRDEEIVALQTKALELFGEPFDDRIERSGIAPSIRDVAVALNITPLKARKILITAGYYTVRDGEIFFNRKAKNVTWETVIKAFHQARELQKEKGSVDGQKEFGTFGASYLYPVFLRLGVCSKKKGIIKKQ